MADMMSGQAGGQKRGGRRVREGGCDRARETTERERERERERLGERGDRPLWKTGMYWRKHCVGNACLHYKCWRKERQKSVRKRRRSSPEKNTTLSFFFSLSFFLLDTFSL
jgi:hypothetical protein